jgi:hypothetical protein
MQVRTIVPDIREDYTEPPARRRKPSVRVPRAAAESARFTPTVGANRVDHSTDVESGGVSDQIPGGTAASGPRIALLVGLTAVVFWALAVAVVSSRHYGGDIRGLLCLGEEFHLPPPFDPIPRSGPAGYDGQQYAALATDPFLRRLATPAAFDAPPYRASRILVPLLAWALALGNPAAAIVAYQLLCWGLGLAAVFLVARWLAAEGHSPWWALILVANAGLAAAILRSTLDGAAICLILAALFAHSRGRFSIAVAMATAAVLTREVAYLAALAIALDELRHRRPVRAMLAAGIPLVPFLSWQVYLNSVLGASGLAGGKLGIPLTGLLEKLQTLLHGSGPSVQDVFVVCAIAATTLALVSVASRPSTWTPLELAFLAVAALGLLLRNDAYLEGWGYCRIMIAAPFLATVIAERQTSHGRRWMLRAVAFFYLLIGLLMINEAVSGSFVGQPPAAPPRSAIGGSAAAGSASWPYTLYVLPVANSRGRAGVTWQTRLELDNLARTENTALVELIPAARGSAFFVHTVVTLAAGQQRSWNNALQELFAFSGTGALRISAQAGPIAAESLTSHAGPAGPEAPLLPTLSAAQAIHAGERVTLPGLVHEPVRAMAVRTNVGILNLSTAPTRVRIELYDAASSRLGQIEGDLPALGFVQVDGVFARVRARAVDGGSAVVQALTPGAAFLVYAAAIRGPSAPVAYVFP